RPVWRFSSSSDLRQPPNRRRAKIQKRRSASSRRGRGLRRWRTISCCRRQMLSAANKSLDRIAAAKAHSKQRNIGASRLWSNKREADAASVVVNESLQDYNCAPYSYLKLRNGKLSSEEVLHQRSAVIKNMPDACQWR